MSSQSAQVSEPKLPKLLATAPSGRAREARRKAAEGLAGWTCRPLGESCDALEGAVGRLHKLPNADLRAMAAIRRDLALANEVRASSSRGAGTFNRIDREAASLADEIAYSVVKPRNSPAHSALTHLLLHPLPPEAELNA